MAQQTAVEYIIEKLQSAQWEYTPWPERRKIIEQAKQMEKEQLNIARLDGIHLANKGYGK
jgi:hypothetical protein